MKKIVALLGSPRAGSNSALIVQKVIDAAAAAGEVTSESFELYKIDFSGCIACMGCKKSAEECVLRDDLTHALRAIREADVFILASPVYFGQITGPVKCAIDRMYSLMAPTYLSGGPVSRLAPGKQCVIVLTQGAPDENAFADVFPQLSHFLGPQWFGFDMHLLRGVGLSMPGAAADNAALMAQAEELGKQLMA